MRFKIAAILLLLCCGCAETKFPAAAAPLCVGNPAALPASWRPPAKLKTALNRSAWSADEANDAMRAAKTGVDELNRFYSSRHSAVAALGDNAVESLIDASYGASITPALRQQARDGAREVLVQLTTPYLNRPAGNATCREFSTLLTFTNYAHALLPADDPRLARMVARTNAAYASCGSFDAAIGSDFRRTLSRPGASIDDVWDLVIWSIVFTDAQTVPGLALPPEARELPASLWRYLADYALDNARSHPDGASNEKFYDRAYLMTHVAYIPTGYGRYAIHISDAPRVYQFLRENFYAVLEMGELDLTAEFVDLFREYGCTEENDLQLRDGTRYLLKLFHSAGDSWMAYREPYEHDEPDSYDLIHKAWTGLSAVRPRIAEIPAPGTYGALIRAWLKH